MISLCSASLTHDIKTDQNIDNNTYDCDELPNLAMCVLGNDFYRANVLLENGTDIHEDDDIAIRIASEIGNFKMTALLVIYSADVFGMN
jgi:hypothetical protein